MINVSVMAACGRRGQMSCNGQIPWRSPQDYNEFKKKTKDGILIVGGRAFHSIQGRLAEDKDNWMGLIGCDWRGDVTPEDLVEDLFEEGIVGNVWVVGGAYTIDKFYPLVTGEVALNVLPYDNPVSEDHLHTFFPLKKYGLEI